MMDHWKRGRRSLVQAMLLIVVLASLPACTALVPKPAERADMTIIHQSPDGRSACIEQQYDVDGLNRPSFPFWLRIRRYLGCGHRQDNDS